METKGITCKIPLDPGSYTHLGVAGKLLEEVSQRLRKEGKKAVPICSYAVKWFEKHPEYSDLLSSFQNS